MEGLFAIPEDASLWSMLAGALFIGALRIVDVSLDTVRIIFLVRGRHWQAGIIGFFEAVIWLVAVVKVIQPPFQLLQVVGYAGGFAAGNVTGAYLASWLASQYVLLRVLSPMKGREIAEWLRLEGYGVTSLLGEGRDGERVLLFVVTSRRRVKRALAMIRAQDENAFVVVDPVHQAIGGFIPGATGLPVGRALR